VGSVQKQGAESDADGFPIRVPATFEEADAVAGRRVDRRCRYLIAPNDSGKRELCELAQWTESCSGCRYPDGTNDGCHECGYHGVCRVSMFLPVTIADECRKEFAS
jgi:hypothetical protein